jgi:hypothetical protein
MRRKPVPPVPEDLATVAAVRGELSLAPRTEESCCEVLMARTQVPSQDEAKSWLTFLTALGLAEEVDGKYVRTREPADPTREELAEAFHEGVFGVRELLEILETSGQVGVDRAFEAFREHVPNWERHRTDHWEKTWRERVERILSWAVLLGIAERDEDGFRAVES